MEFGSNCLNAISWFLGFINVFIVCIFVSNLFFKQFSSYLDSSIWQVEALQFAIIAHHIVVFLQIMYCIKFDDRIWKLVHVACCMLHVARCMLGHRTLLTQHIQHKPNILKNKNRRDDGNEDYDSSDNYIYVHKKISLHTWTHSNFMSYIVYGIGPLSFSDGLWFSYWLMNWMEIAHSEFTNHSMHNAINIW